MTYDRREALRTVGGSYLPVDGLACCVYCGDTGKLGHDHVPPLFVADWVEEPRRLYPACGVCNRLLGPYPVACLRLRAEYLLCRLRVEWIKLRGGRKVRWPVERIRACAEGVKHRLARGSTGEACRCQHCIESRLQAIGWMRGAGHGLDDGS